ncbi:hypothetical protein HMPREF9078_01652 [Capnocytophaga sp. oral taxon 380 str. F0488]|nr:hypothetical protein HMPREF9078_01652 [Capnocytophaga sp. oral taxon 380 str. F0488]
MPISILTAKVVKKYQLPIFKLLLLCLTFFLLLSYFGLFNSF